MAARLARATVARVTLRGFERIDGYLPIEAYGLIGDCRSAALVGADGSIDWLCLPRFDHPSVFARLLDAHRGGHWIIAPTDACRAQQRYRDRSNILETLFHTATGTVVVSDFMPIDSTTDKHHARHQPTPRVVRIVECLTGHAEIRHQFAPRPDYAAARVAFTSDGYRRHGDSAEMHLCLHATVPLPHATVRWRMRAGDVIALGLAADGHGKCAGSRLGWSVEHAQRLLRTTTDYWWSWIDRCDYDGPYRTPVVRSALALKLMTYSPTGAIVAAPTTSLPEQVGGERNWDYRYTWLRDASFTLYAFFQVGMLDEARDFFAWLMRTGIGARGRDVANLYTLDGTARADEIELPQLSGYMDSRPVRIGNAAINQLQLDVYGELLDSAYLYARFGGTISRTLWGSLRAIVELAIDRWRQPDASIWEPRGNDQHFTYSTVMCWVAIDRGIRIADRFRLPCDRARWMRARREVHRAVTARGWSPEVGAFTQTLDGHTLDAALLRMSMVRVLPGDDPRLRATIDAVARGLGDGVLVRRYDVAEMDDGVRGSEGAFLLCSFWLADALAHAGEIEAAQQWFERLLVFASPLGLYSEEVDTATGRLLGNFPQAFTHLSLIGAAVNIERARHRHLGVHGLRRHAPRAAPRRRRSTTA